MDLQTETLIYMVFMGSNCTRGIAENVRDELWSYFALSGLLFLNIGIVLMVYALKRATTHPTVLEVFGIGLIIMGVMATLASWYVHRQHRQRKPLCSCAFCCCRAARNTSSDDSLRVSLKRRARDYRARLSLDNSVHKHTPTLEQGIRMFSTIEFQTYAEYTKRDNVGVQENETRKEIRRFKVESQRQKKQVHPQRSRDLPQAATFTNSGYSRKASASSQRSAPGSPLVFQLITPSSPVKTQLATNASFVWVQPSASHNPVIL